VSPCRKNPCLNRGVCKEISRTNFACDCKQGFEGERCQDVIAKAKPGEKNEIDFTFLQYSKYFGKKFVVDGYLENETKLYIEKDEKTLTCF